MCLAQHASQTPQLGIELSSVLDCTNKAKLVLQSIDSDPNGIKPLLRSTFSPSDDVGYREASFARSQDSMTQPPIYSRLAGQSVSGKHVCTLHTMHAEHKLPYSNAKQIPAIQQRKKAIAAV